MRFALFALTAAAVLGSSPAQSTVALTYTGSSDTAFDGAGGYLNAIRGLQLINNSALIPLERAVGEARIGVAGERRVGFHVPTPATGFPEPTGSGVTTALTNVAPVGQSFTAWQNGVATAFSIERIGTTLTYSVGLATFSATASYFADVNAFSIRVRSQSGATNALALTGLTYQEGTSGPQILDDVSAASGSLAIRLFEGVSGDFKLTGNYTFSWTGPSPTRSQLAAQIKLLDVAPVPEPATWAMMIAGFGLAGAAMRRRERSAAAA